MSSPDRDQFRVLDTLLTDVLQLKEAGGPHSRLAHAQGYADGYMRMLLDSKLATQAELLRRVSEVRSRFYGPAVAQVAVAGGVDDREGSVGVAA